MSIFAEKSERYEKEVFQQSHFQTAAEHPGFRLSGIRVLCLLRTCSQRISEWRLCRQYQRNPSCDPCSRRLPFRHTFRNRSDGFYPIRFKKLFSLCVMVRGSPKLLTWNDGTQILRLSILCPYDQYRWYRFRLRLMGLSHNSNHRGRCICIRLLFPIHSP